MSPKPRIGVVILTQGRRPDDLRRAIESVLRQQDVALDIVVVGNAWDPAGTVAQFAADHAGRSLGSGAAADRVDAAGAAPDSYRLSALALAENLGIPAGRNAGVSQVQGEYLFFLDDDASVPSSSFLADACAVIATDPTIGLLQPRVVDPSGITSPRRWTPRIRKGDPTASGNVFSVWEGAVVLRRSTFDRAGGWAGEFFYAHEGIELAWRVWDQGLRVWYAGELVANHPAIEPTRHSYYYRLNARNRVWLARRNLPALLVPVYVGSWTGIQMLRWGRRPRALKAWFRGWREGWAESPGDRRPISWRTVARMTVSGRPPFV